ncbi:hypothetical protein LOD99_907 [Oopsacas minuta]|uniref:J domain-containing protein n=1 Tax=Oopsacas minuta TaxID=111878 RepID=A0AAV7K0P8_9METZ|nr:hypothetical protein LOD99_907 [Oopsacas minuta]
MASSSSINNFIKEFGETDLYTFLGVSIDSNVKEITSAYRKTALKYHPDKNPDEASAAMFRKLTSVYSLLTDNSARSAYDNLVRTRLASEKRRLEFSVKRRKLMQDLERREKQGEDLATKKMNHEIARLRKEGEARLLAETEILRQESKPEDETTCILRVKWELSKDVHCSYTKKTLTQMFAKYAESTTVVVSAGKGRALVELKSGPWTFQAINEVGINENPLTVEWLRKG